MTVDRLGVVVAAAVAAAVVLAGVVGVEAQGSPLVLALPLGLIGLGWMLFRRRGGGVELRWAGRAPSTIGVALGGDEWAAGVAPLARAPARRREVVAALARFESRAWLSSPWYGAGVGFCVLLTILFGWVFAGNADDGFGGAWRDWFVLFPVMAHPMVGMAVVGAHHAVTRARRDGVEELFSACPADDATRTAAHLRAGWVPAATVAAFIVASTALFARNSPLVYGPVDARSLADVVTAVVLAVCGPWLGVALARWAPWRIVPVVFVAALAPVIIRLGEIGEPHWSNARQLSTWPRYPDHDLLFTDPPIWWHLLWVAALGGLMAWFAVVRVQRSRRTVVVGIALAIVATGAGIAQTRPLSHAEADRLASLVAEPQRHQACRSAGRAEVCVYRGYEDYLDQVLTEVAPVGRALPPTVAPFTFRQLFDGDLDVLGPEVADALRGRTAPINRDLPLGFGSQDAAMAGARLTTALHAVGLPVRAGPGGVPAVVAGEARGVAALWLAARDLDADDAQQLARHHFNPDDRPEDPTPTAFDLGSAWPDPCTAFSPPIVWSAQDLAAARALLGVPAESVHRLLLEGWNRFTDPATTTDELLVAAGLDPVGPPDRIDPVPVTCSY